jgi:hypothetical protein
MWAEIPMFRSFARSFMDFAAGKEPIEKDERPPPVSGCRGYQYCLDSLLRFLEFFYTGSMNQARPATRNTVTADNESWGSSGAI